MASEFKKFPPNESQTLITAETEYQNSLGDSAFQSTLWVLFIAIFVGTIAPAIVLAVLQQDACLNQPVPQLWWLTTHAALWFFCAVTAMPAWLICTHDYKITPITYGLSIASILLISITIVVWAIVGAVMIDQNGCHTQIMLAYVILDFLLSIGMLIVVPMFMCCVHC